MDPLSSFAINYALGVLFNFLRRDNDDVDKQIRLAFKSALNNWAIDPGLRGNKENWLKCELKYFLEKSDGTIPDDLNSEIVAFLRLFQKSLAESKHQAAYNYLSMINNTARYKELTEKLDKILNILKDQEIDPRD